MTIGDNIRKYREEKEDLTKCLKLACDLLRISYIRYTSKK